MKVAFIIGHRNVAGGAINWKGTNEYTFHKNEVVPNLVLFAPTGINVKIFDKDNDNSESVAKKVALWGADVCIELHYNWSDGVPKTQFEILASKNYPESCKYAKRLAKKMNLKRPILTLRRDEGLFAVDDGDRGWYNVEIVNRYGVKVAILLEPCFGNTKSPASEYVIGNPKQYAKDLIDCIYEIFKEDVGFVQEQQGNIKQDATLEGLVSAYKNYLIEYTALKDIVLAQWLLETNRVKTELAKKHYNFGGLKYRIDVPNMPKGCYKIKYKAKDGEDFYFGCDSYETFFDLYWNFLKRSPYKGFERYINDPIGFIKFIASAGYCPEKDYADKVIKLLPEASKLLRG